LGKQTGERKQAMRRKVLIICRSYYPHYGPQAQRMANFAKYLPRFGWEPVVLCSESTARNDSKYDPKLVDKNVCRTIRVPYNIGSTKAYFDFLVRKALRDLSLDVFLILSPLRMYRDMLARADVLLRQEQFDVILATSPLPFTLAIADKLSSKYQIPWVADFRDLPTEHKANLGCFSPCRLLTRFCKNYCKSADALITVSEPLRDELVDWHSKPVHLVYNGFNPDDFPKDVEPRRDCFTIVYCGTIHTGRNPALLVDALDLILKEDGTKLDRFRLLIHGVSKICFRRYFANRPCSHLIDNGGRVPFGESIKVQQEASALLLLPSSGLQGLMTAKIFEYLGSGRPILSVPGDGGVTDAVLEETKAGVVGGTAEEIAEILLSWIDQWQRNGKVEYNPRQDKIQFYTRENQTKRLAEIFEKVVAAKV
jgi:glycosyltransferase involved in cell wall biosynthesis